MSDIATTHSEGNHSAHVHQCGCAICLARCEGAAWERRRILQQLAERRAVMAYPGTGHLTDTVLWRDVLDLLDS